MANQGAKSRCRRERQNGRMDHLHAQVVDKVQERRVTVFRCQQDLIRRVRRCLCHLLILEYPNPVPDKVFQRSPEKVVPAVQDIVMNERDRPIAIRATKDLLVSVHSVLDRLKMLRYIQNLSLIHI